MLLDGFVAFRLKEYETLLGAAIKQLVEECITRHEYENFISLLKYFVNIQEPRPELTHVYVLPDGTYELFLDSARELCRERMVPVCDCYRKWKLMHENGVDVTELLANRVNHPTREMHFLFAGMLIDTMFAAE